MSNDCGSGGLQSLLARLLFTPFVWVAGLSVRHPLLIKLELVVTLFTHVERVWTEKQD
jgi:hypothetical protein